MINIFEIELCFRTFESANKVAAILKGDAHAIVDVVVEF